MNLKDIINTISLLFSATSIALIIVHIFLRKRRENFETKIRSGQCCYLCKDYIEGYNYFTPKNPTDLEFRFCKKCERDHKLNQFLSTKPIKLFYGTRRAMKLPLVIFMLSILIQLMGTLIKIYDINILGVLGTMLVCAGMELNNRNFKALSRKKTH